PPIASSADPADRREEELLSIVPRDRRKPYKVRRILEAVFDEGSVFELGARYGGSLVTALARLGGRPVGVLASDPRYYGGGMTAAASDKLVRLVDACDQFRVPIVNFVDQPGFLIGSESERQGTISRGTRARSCATGPSVHTSSSGTSSATGRRGAGSGPDAALRAPGLTLRRCAHLVLQHSADLLAQLRRVLVAVHGNGVLRGRAYDL